MFDHVIRSRKQVSAELIHVNVMKRISRKEMHFLKNSLQAKVSEDLDGMLLELEGYVLGNCVETVDIEERFPINLWEHFKERCLPDWFVNRWPVKYQVISVHKRIMNACPHIDIKLDRNGRQDQRPHLEFLFPNAAKEAQCLSSAYSSPVSRSETPKRPA